MGYQESLIYTSKNNPEQNNKDIEGMIEIFQKYDIRCKGDYNATAVAKVHLKADMDSFKKGTTLLWISGDRYPQRSKKYLFNIDPEANYPDYNFTKEEKKLINKTKICFIEYMGQFVNKLEALRLKVDNANELFEVEDISLLPELTENHELIEKSFNEILTKFCKLFNVENPHEVGITKEEEINKFEEIILEIFKVTDYKITKEIKEETIDGSIRIDNSFYINGVFFASINYLSWNKEYSFWYYNMQGQELRDICKELEKIDLK